MSDDLQTIRIPLNIELTFKGGKPYSFVVSPFEVPLGIQPGAAMVDDFPAPVPPNVAASSNCRICGGTGIVPLEITGGARELCDCTKHKAEPAPAKRDPLDFAHPEDRALFDLIRHFENDPLRKKPDDYVDRLRTDTIGRGTPKEIGYGITPNGLADLRRYGFTTVPNSLPETMTKREADLWVAEKTMPCYQAMVAKVMLGSNFKPQLHQLNALAAFAYNCGEANLRTLVGAPGTGKTGRLYQGETDYFERTHALYCRADGVVYAGLQRRRRAEAALWRGEGFNPDAAAA